MAKKNDYIRPEKKAEKRIKHNYNQPWDKIKDETIAFFKGAPCQDKVLKLMYNKWRLLNGEHTDKDRVIDLTVTHHKVRVLKSGAKKVYYKGHRGLVSFKQAHAWFRASHTGQKIILSAGEMTDEQIDEAFITYQDEKKDFKKKQEKEK